jgi:L-lactate dehydrogenase complex protein LldE
MHFAEILASTLENPAAVSGDVRLTTGRTAR